MKKILILGATSGMARAMVRRLAGPEAQLVLAGRDINELEKIAADAAVRAGGPKPLVAAFDARDTGSHPAFWEQEDRQNGPFDEVYLFFGTMHDQIRAQQDPALAADMIAVNYAGAVSVLEPAAAAMEQRRRGIIVAVSSVAGDRGRQSNYLYGSAKAALSVYLQGLRNRLARSGVHVLTVKPGFVDTPMTQHLRKGLLFAKPDAIARGIEHAVRKRKNAAYLPGFWQYIMWVIRLIPEPIFKKLSL